jgi:5-methylcytosine-specific restriction endonuclease McrA
MTHESLETITDDDLLTTVRRLTARANVALADLLLHLGEVEARGIHRTRACASLYTYCIYELRMSEDAAFRRSKAARLVRQYPELHGIVAKGEIHLTGLLMIAPYLGGERHTEMLQRARFRSKREIARLIARIDPKPDVPAMVEPIGPAGIGRATHQAFMEALAGPVRALPAGDRPADWVQPDDPSAANDGDEPDPLAPSGTNEERPADEIEQPLRYKVQFTASREYIDLLNEAVDLLGHEKPSTSLPDVHLRAMRELVARLKKDKRAARAAPARQSEEGSGTAPERKPLTAATTPETPNRGRHISAAVRRAVWQRDENRCAYVDCRGHRCRETRRLEVHHRHAYALGGPATLENLELRCASHNLLAAEEDFGREHMDWTRGVAEPCIQSGTSVERSLKSGQ